MWPLEDAVEFEAAALELRNAMLGGRRVVGMQCYVGAGLPERSARWAPGCLNAVLGGRWPTLACRCACARRENAEA